MKDLDWRWLRSFVAVADHAKMQDASDMLGISQPTVSRHIKHLEEQLNLTLFDRNGTSLVLSEKGQALYEHAKLVQTSVLNFERQAMSESNEESGIVKVMMHCMLGYHFAPKWLNDLHACFPQVSIDLNIDDRTSLLLREAEISVHTEKPSQLDLISQKVGRFTLGFYASDSYLAQHDIGFFADLLTHKLIGFDQITAMIDKAHEIGLNLTRDSFVVRSDLWALHPILIQQSLGLGIIPIRIGETLGLTRVYPEFSLVGDEIYLSAHPDLKRNPRIRIVWDHLFKSLCAWFS